MLCWCVFEFWFLTKGVSCSRKRNVGWVENFWTRGKIHPTPSGTNLEDPKLKYTKIQYYYYHTILSELMTETMIRDKRVRDKRVRDKREREGEGEIDESPKSPKWMRQMDAWSKGSDDRWVSQKEKDEESNKRMFEPWPTLEELLADCEPLSVDPTLAEDSDYETPSSSSSSDDFSYDSEMELEEDDEEEEEEEIIDLSSCPYCERDLTHTIVFKRFGFPEAFRLHLSDTTESCNVEFTRTMKSISRIPIFTTGSRFVDLKDVPYSEMESLVVDQCDCASCSGTMGMGVNDMYSFFHPSIREDRGSNNIRFIKCNLDQ